MADSDSIPHFLIRKDGPRIAGVYKIHCFGNGKFYIGSSIHVKRRWNAHRSGLVNGVHHCARLQRCWTKYGPFSITLSVVEILDSPSRDELVAAENRHMKLAGKMLLNSGSVAGAPMTGLTHRADARRRISEAHRGRIISEATRHRMRLAQAGKIPRTGWHHSAESKRKMSVAILASGVNGMLGKRHSKETKLKISISNKARPQESFRRGGNHGMARKVEIEGIVYDCALAASIALDVQQETVRQRIWRGMGRYLDEPSSHPTKPWGIEDKTGKNHKNARAVLVGELWFPCCKDAAKHFKIHPSSFVEWIQKGKARYADGLPPMRIGPKPRRPSKSPSRKLHKRMVPVTIDGVRYPSVGIAAEEIGVSKSSIRNWLHSGSAAYATT